MTKHQIEVITSVERRRRGSPEEKEQLVAATFEPWPAFPRSLDRPAFMGASFSTSDKPTFTVGIARSL